MAEILVKAQKTGSGKLAYARGSPVVVMPDGHEWGLEERPPKFFVLKVPGVPEERVLKYLKSSHRNVRRDWVFAIDDLPAGVKQKLATDGNITIWVQRLSEPEEWDYTWLQVRAFLRNQLLNRPEDEDL